MAGEGSEAGLAVDGGEDVESELFWAFYDDVVSCRVPADHMVVVWLLEKTERKREKKGKKKRREAGEERGGERLALRMK